MKFSLKHIFCSHSYLPIIILLILACAPNMGHAQEKYDDDSDIVEDFGEEQEPVREGLADTVQAPTLRHVPDSAVRRLKEDKNFAYANDSAYWNKKRSEKENGFLSALGSFARSGIARALFYIAIIGFLLFVFYQVIIVNRLYIFSSSTRTVNKEEELPEESSMTKEQLEQRLSAAVTNSDYRLAVRYLYLVILFDLKQKGLVTINSNTTNHELIDQLAGRKQVSDFRQLAQIYEYVWYGEFKLSADQYSKVSRGYRDFQNSLRS